MQTKKCSKCRLEKEVENEFYKRSNSKDGYRHECKECRKKRDAEYYQNNKEKRSLQKKQYYQNNRKIIINNNTNYRKNNREHLNKKTRERINNRPDLKFLENTRKRIRNYFKSINVTKKNKTFDIIGCSPQNLKLYIENQFDDGMNWNNYGMYGWHLDHKIPLSSARNNQEKIYELCHYTNLKPLWSKDNLKKGSKIL